MRKLAGVPLACGRRSTELHFQVDSQELQSLDVPSKDNRAQTKKKKKTTFLKGASFLEHSSNWSLVLWSSCGILLQIRGPFIAKCIEGKVHPYATVHVLSDCSYLSIIFVLAAFVSADHVRPEKALFSKSCFPLSFSNNVTNCLSPHLKSKTTSGFKGCSLSVIDQHKKCLCSEFRVPTFYEDQFPLQGFDS